MAATQLGIDLGTSTVRIAVEGRGVVLREASVLAVDEVSGRVIAAGDEAREMLGRAPASIRVVRPLAKGVIADYEYAEKLIRCMVERVCARRVFKPRAAVSIPASVTEVEQRSVVQAMTTVGIRRVALIEEYVAAAVGAGLDVTRPHGCMAVNLGAGTTDAVVLSLRGVTAAHSERVGGDNMDEAIVRMARSECNLLIGAPTAEQVKKAIGSAVPSEAEMPVRGRDVLTGLPSVRTVTAEQVRRALEEPLQQMVDAIQSVLESAPPETVSDVLTDGLVLTGGGALLKGMAEYVSRQTGVTCHVAEQPEDCVALGVVRASQLMQETTGGVYDINQFTYDRTDWG